ncbi:NADAR family protein [Hymenobacter sp. BT186]|uniref:NADAR family protein n=1 Tax=Hymenobacter telluris TaxID=2816474 RepID=A0A939JAZ7_9BACT|nr:NADAR family protein [Hymenobacter telluris]MBO0360384.1 NADAR family protein [Hymenobacter telluris]MBW3376411.1 NADAR family protein [Hymenobacter norwichensis]
MLAPIRSVADLLQHLNASQPVKYLFFWGHTRPPGAAVGKECFSQWYPAPFIIDNDTYATAEHYMMAEKARLFGDEATRTAILQATHPDQAKKLGRRVQHFDETRWNAARFEVVVRGNAAKFSQHPELRQYLLQTAPRVLVEASPVDAIWGIGLAQDSPHATNPAEWRGLNLLGFALMEVRQELGARS